MSKIGYAYTTEDREYLTKELEGLGIYGCDQIAIETDSEGSATHPHKELDMIMEKLGENDSLIVYELLCLGKSVIQLADFVKELEDKGATLVIIHKEGKLADLDDATYIAFIKKMAEMEKMIIRERTSRGLEEARRHGRVGGRPKISEETVARIRFLYEHNKYTLRQIAEECDISLGTAYKYIQEK